MGQRVRRPAEVVSPLSAAAMRAAVTDRDSTDPDVLALREELLRAPLNRSPAVIAPGDQHYAPVVQLRCSCGAVVGYVAADVCAYGGGSVVVVLWTQRGVDAAGVAARTVPVVLAAPTGTADGRQPTPVPDTAVTECRAHGSIEVQTAPVLAAARAVLGQALAGDTPKARKITVSPSRRSDVPH